MSLHQHSNFSVKEFFRRRRVITTQCNTDSDVSILKHVPRVRTKEVRAKGPYQGSSIVARAHQYIGGLVELWRGKFVIVDSLHTYIGNADFCIFYQHC